MVTPDFEVGFRRRLPKAPNIELNSVSDAIQDSLSMALTQRQTMYTAQKKRLTPEVVATLLSMDTKPDNGESLSDRTNVVRKIEATAIGTRPPTESPSKSRTNTPDNIEMVEIVKRSGQPLGFSVREYEGSETEKVGGIFVSRLTPGGVVEQHSLLRTGDEILEINEVPVYGYKLSDVVAMIQIPRRLVLKVRFGQYAGKRSREKPTREKNNNIYAIEKTTEKNQYTQNNRNSSPQGNTGLSQRKLMTETITETLSPPNLLTTRRNSTGRLLPAPPESEQVKARHVNDHEDNSCPSSSRQQLRNPATSPACTTGLTQNTYNKLRYQNQNSELCSVGAGNQKDVRSSAATPVSTKTKKVTQGKGQLNDAARGSSQATRVDPGDIGFDLVTIISQSSGESILSSRLEDVKRDSKRDDTPKSSPLGLRKNLKPETFGSSSSLSSSDSPKSHSRRPVRVSAPGNIELFQSELRRHSSHLPDGSPLNSSAESEEHVSNSKTNYPAKLNSNQKPPPPIHSLSSDDLGHSHNSWFSKIGNRKYVRKSSEGGHLRTSKTTAEQYRIQESTDLSNDDVDPGYRLYSGSNSSPSSRIESRGTNRAVTGMLALYIVKASGISPGEAALKDKRKKIKVFCTVDSDGIRHACTGIKKSLNNFQWNESFEIEFQRTREIKITVWMRSKKDGDRIVSEGTLCLAQLLSDGSEHLLVLCLEPCGTLYIKLEFTDMKVLLQRTPSQKNEGVFGFPLETVLRRENSRMPIIVRKCVEEINARGLEVTGIYRLCGNAAKKKTLRAQFESCSANVDLGNAENPADVNVITGLLKDYLRELPQPLLSQGVREVLYEASTTGTRDDSRDQFLVNEITKKFSSISRTTIMYLLDHFAMVLMNSDTNKMDSHNLAVCIGPVLMCPSLGTMSISAVSDTKKDINAIKLLLEIWPKPEQVSAC